MHCPIGEYDQASVVRSWLDQAERTGTTDLYVGKRAWPRTTWSVSVVVKIVSGRSTGELVYARGKDVSLGGIGFISRRNIPAHTVVEIWAADHPQCVSGRVMHSTRTVGGYIIGVAFDAPAAGRARRAAG